MPESSIEPSLVSRLLLDRDAEYRRANAAEQLVEELSLIHISEPTRH